MEEKTTFDLDRHYRVYNRIIYSGNFSGMSATYKVLIVLLFIPLIGLAIWWGKYKYHDCLKVGHTKTYCILDLGK